MGLENEMYSPRAEGTPVIRVSARPGAFGPPDVSGVRTEAIGAFGDGGGAYRHHAVETGKMVVDPSAAFVKEEGSTGWAAGTTNPATRRDFRAGALDRLASGLRSTVVADSYADEEYGGRRRHARRVHDYIRAGIINLDGGKYELWNASVGGEAYSVTVKTDFPTERRACADALYLFRAELEKFAQRRREELLNNPLYGHGYGTQRVSLVEWAAGALAAIWIRISGILLFTRRAKMIYRKRTV
jgi:hypothetical protein